MPRRDGNFRIIRLLKKANLDRENYTHIRKLLSIFLRNITQFPFHSHPTFTENDRLSDFKAEFL